MPTARLLTLPLVGLLCAAPALGNDWTAGLLALQRDTAYRGMDADPLVVPFAQVEGERWWWRGLAAGITLHRGEHWEFDALVQGRMEGFDADDSAFFLGMADRQRSLDVGLQARRGVDAGQWRVTLLTDALGRHGGSEVQLGWQGEWRRGPLLVQPGVTAAWQSGALVNYYFGIDASEARPDRAAYRAGSGWRTEASLSALMPLSNHWALFGRVAAQRLPASAADSPLVDRGTERSFLLGVGYRWGGSTR